MPFGLYNDPAIFQCCIMSLFSDMVECFIEIFMNDFSIYGDSFDQCLHLLELVHQHVLKRAYHLSGRSIISWSNMKLFWGKKFLEKIEVDKAKVEVITKLPKPKCVKDIQSILGDAGFCRRFIKDFSEIARPLTNLLVKDVLLILTMDV